MFTLNDRVVRDELRESRGAAIVELDLSNEEPLYRLTYDEGGQGWWPHSALSAEIDGGDDGE